MKLPTKWPIQTQDKLWFSLRLVIAGHKRHFFIHFLLIEPNFPAFPPCWIACHHTTEIRKSKHFCHQSLCLRSVAKLTLTPFRDHGVGNCRGKLAMALSANLLGLRFVNKINTGKCITTSMVSHGLSLACKSAKLSKLFTQWRGLGGNGHHYCWKFAKHANTVWRSERKMLVGAFQYYN